MGMSPSRMPQAQGMMAGHGGGNMVGQTANQGQFLPQTQFPPGPAVAATGAMNVTVGPGMGQAPAQAPVTQVRPWDEAELQKFNLNFVYVCVVWVGGWAEQPEPVQLMLSWTFSFLLAQNSPLYIQARGYVPHQLGVHPGERCCDIVHLPT